MNQLPCPPSFTLVNIVGKSFWSFVRWILFYGFIAGLIVAGLCVLVFK